jgi:hypothetical protein
MAFDDARFSVRHSPELLAQSDPLRPLMERKISTFEGVDLVQQA